MEELQKLGINNEQLYEIIQNIKINPTPLSSNIVGIGYDIKYNILKVIFKPNTTYIYYNVEPTVYASIVKADSVGRALNESVVRQKDRYKYQRITNILNNNIDKN